ncbi:universal stress protein [uncultured Winogradskyella sp.]|uniref:universal stress protein n=1 Tax=uncultured Winogradskyella sp. TaxID=395353 RepID=UPI0035159504
MKNILIPTDFSDNAMNAIRYALELCKHDTSEFYFLHTYEEEVYNNHDLHDGDDFEEAVDIAKNRSQLKLDLLLKEVTEIAPHKRFKFHCISAYNSLIDEMDKLVIGKNIDLVIMGTKGESEGKTYAFGSNTLQVLKYVSCPVLVIPELYTYKQPKHVLFPTNYLIPYRRRELKLLSTLLAPFRSVVDLLYISRAKKLSKRQLDNKDFLRSELVGVEVNDITEDSNKVSLCIANYVKDNAIDFLVMVNTRHSFLEDMLFRSKVDDMCLHTNIPFLVLQNVRRTV